MESTGINWIGSDIQSDSDYGAKSGKVTLLKDISLRMQKVTRREQYTLNCTMCLTPKKLCEWQCGVSSLLFCLKLKGCV